MCEIYMHPFQLCGVVLASWCRHLRAVLYKGCRTLHGFEVHPHGITHLHALVQHPQRVPTLGLLEQLLVPGEGQEAGEGEGEGEGEGQGEGEGEGD